MEPRICEHPDCTEPTPKPYFRFCDTHFIPRHRRRKYDQGLGTAGQIASFLDKDQKAKDKRQLFHHQKGICVYCGHKYPFNKLQMEHMIPKAQGGQDHIRNCQLACATCNQAKGTMTDIEFRELHADVLPQEERTPASPAIDPNNLLTDEQKQQTNQCFAENAWIRAYMQNDLPELAYWAHSFLSEEQREDNKQRLGIYWSHIQKTAKKVQTQTDPDGRLYQQALDREIEETPEERTQRRQALFVAHIDALRSSKGVTIKDSDDELEALIAQYGQETTEDREKRIAKAQALRDVLPELEPELTEAEPQAEEAKIEPEDPLAQLTQLINAQQEIQSAGYAGDIDTINKYAALLADEDNRPYLMKQFGENFSKLFSFVDTYLRVAKETLQSQKEAEARVRAEVKARDEKAESQRWNEQLDEAQRWAEGKRKTLEIREGIEKKKEREQAQCQAEAQLQAEAQCQANNRRNILITGWLILIALALCIAIHNYIF